MVSKDCLYNDFQVSLFDSGSKMNTNNYHSSLQLCGQLTATFVAWDVVLNIIPVGLRFLPQEQGGLLPDINCSKVTPIYTGKFHPWAKKNSHLKISPLNLI